jgi:hypothetical protein
MVFQSSLRSACPSTTGWTGNGQGRPSTALQWRTGRAMMNGHLMSCGIDAISVPALRRREFNTLMVDFYRSKDATGIFGFLLSCHPDRLTA